MCCVRAAKAKHLRFVLLSALYLVILLTLLAAIVAVWFIYGVSHSGKSATSDFMVLASTCVPAYVGALGARLLTSYITRRLDPPKTRFPKD